jgi:hypothetical protein
VELPVGRQQAVAEEFLQVRGEPDRRHVAGVLYQEGTDVARVEAGDDPALAPEVDGGHVAVGPLRALQEGQRVGDELEEVAEIG